MPPQINVQPLMKLPKYPHLEPLDTAIWNAFLDTKPWSEALVAYDLHVGTSATVPLGSPDNYRRMVEHLSTLRIDAVIFLPDQTLCIEIKPSASLSAIGQALGYTILLRQALSEQIPGSPRVIPTIVTDLPKPDTQYVCDVVHVRLLSLGKAIAP